MRIAVIDGQGGGIGKAIVEKVRKELPEYVDIIALGMNALTTYLMIKAGANEGATGANLLKSMLQNYEITSINIPYEI